MWTENNRRKKAGDAHSAYFFDGRLYEHRKYFAAFTCVYIRVLFCLFLVHMAGEAWARPRTSSPRNKILDTPLLEPSCYFMFESLGSHVSGRRIKPVNPYLIDVNLAAAIAQRLNQSHSSLVTFGPSFYVSGGHGSFVPRVLPLRLFRALPSPRPVIFFFTLLLRFSLL